MTEKNLRLTIETDGKNRAFVTFHDEESGDNMEYVFDTTNILFADRSLRSDVIQTTGQEIWSWISLIADLSECEE